MFHSMCISAESTLRMNEVLTLGSSLSSKIRSPIVYLSSSFTVEINILRHHELSFSHHLIMIFIVYPRDKRDEI
jgi:hypothetical protein